MQLSNAIYTPNSRSGKIKGENMPHTASTQLGAIAYNSLLARLKWMIHIVEAKERVGSILWIELKRMKWWSSLQV
jgi:hypothetical protein